MYKLIEIESSYKRNNLGRTLYDLVLEKKPKVIVEFGCLYGYSTVAMAMALRDLGQGKIISYDIWEKYAYKHTTISTAAANINKYGLSDFVEFRDYDFWNWLESDKEQFDMLHLDISNDGDTIQQAYNSLQPQIENGALLVFEGGSVERDEEEWMIKYNKTPFNSVKQNTQYTVLTGSWPSISTIQHD
jgi:predicted O-methyltransferase YrrM